MKAHPGQHPTFSRCGGSLPQTRGDTAKVSADPNAINAVESSLAWQLTGIAHAAKTFWGYPRHWMDAWLDDLAISAEEVTKNPTFGYWTSRRLVGFYCVALDASVASLEHLWILPGFMRRGIGRALFIHMEGEIAKQGCTTISIESDPHAKAFYERMGATHVGYRRTSMEGVPRDLPILRKEL